VERVGRVSAVPGRIGQRPDDLGELRDRARPAVQVTGPRFVPREVPGGDAAGYVSRSVSSAPYRYQARVRLHLPADVAAARVPPTVGHLEADGDQACILVTGASSLAPLAVYVALVGAEFEVIEPAALADYLLVLAARLTRAAQGQTAQGERPASGC
jgi:hypothetical protein